MKILLIVIIGLTIWIAPIACANDTPNHSFETPFPSSTLEPVEKVSTPNLIAAEATVKIVISVEDEEYINSGVIVGDGHFAVTYAPEISADSTITEVKHVSSKAVTTGSIIYFDEIFGLALIRLTDDLGSSVEISQSVPNLGEKLIIGDFLPIGGEDLTVTRHSKLAGFEFGGLIMGFAGILGSGNAGGPVLNEKGQLIGIVAQGLREGESGSAMSLETFKYGLAEELVTYNEAVIGTELNYDLNLIGISAHVTKPPDWNVLAGLGYFDIRAPEFVVNKEDPSSNGYKLIGAINADSSAEETSEEVLNRAIAEFGDSFKLVPELVIPDQDGFDACVLLITINEYSRNAFERRGHVIPGAWLSHPGIYTGLCTGIGKVQRVIVFAESYDVADIIDEDGLFKKFNLVQR